MLFQVNQAKKEHSILELEKIAYLFLIINKSEESSNTANLNPYFTRKGTYFIRNQYPIAIETYLQQIR